MLPGNSPTDYPPPRIFISAAEPSGDRHAAALIQAVRTLETRASFWGVAGPLMQQAGCEAVDDFTQRSAMLLGAVRLAARAWRLVRQIRHRMTRDPADLAILVDSPALHLPMARHIRAAGVPVLGYIAPQLWAWAPWRIRRLRRRVNRLAAILPFEEEYFRGRGVDARFVGHPLVAQLRKLRADPATVNQYKEAGSPVIACLPGSRRHVVLEVLPGQIEVARKLAASYPRAAFLFAAADRNVAAMIRAGLTGESFRHRVEIGRNTEILAAADLALVASGTATLEVAWHRVPMVVMYNGSKWGYRLAGRFLIHTPHLCLVNILSGKRAVPEFMPYYTSTDPIADEALDLLADEARRTAVRADLDTVIRSLGTEDAAARTARMALEMIRDKSASPRPGRRRGHKPRPWA
ncbi:MAG TPA: lipid-A-disaccharide synthase [Phycisphaerae bacterium]|nr:lipid-A-disaccharide synthase [Phycisphaerae bacterium]